jgi:transcription antitermination protein NusB
MRNRRNVRVKVMQSLYGFYHPKENKTTTAAEKELIQNIDKLYQLYLYLLCYLNEIVSFSRLHNEQAKSKFLPDKQQNVNNLRLFQAPAMQTMLESEKLKKAFELYHIQWNGQDDLIRKIFLDLKSSELYQDYIHATDEKDYEDEEILTYILKHYASNHNLFQQHLEESFSNCWDDKKIAVSMAAKTIKKLTADPENDDFLSPVSLDPDDTYGFAKELFKETVTNYDKLRSIIDPKLTKWEPNQIAKVDGIILAMAVCEFLYFPSIPANVTINEYLELSKTYSTPNSKKFINGVLDAIHKDIEKEGKLKKG